MSDLPIDKEKKDPLEEISPEIIDAAQENMILRNLVNIYLTGNIDYKELLEEAVVILARHSESLTNQLIEHEMRNSPRIINPREFGI